MSRSPELPQGALLLYEQWTDDEQERDGNARFYVREDGAFFHQRNREGGDPQRRWDAGFPPEPVRRLGAGAVGELRAALSGFPAGEHRRPPGAPEPSHPTTERWTAMVDGRPVTALLEQEAPAPPALADLRDLLDRLVAASARA